MLAYQVRAPPLHKHSGGFHSSRVMVQYAAQSSQASKPWKEHFIASIGGLRRSVFRFSSSFQRQGQVHVQFPRPLSLAPSLPAQAGVSCVTLHPLVMYASTSVTRDQSAKNIPHPKTIENIAKYIEVLNYPRLIHQTTQRNIPTH